MVLHSLRSSKALTAPLASVDSLAPRSRRRSYIMLIMLKPPMAPSLDMERVPCVNLATDPYSTSRGAR